MAAQPLIVATYNIHRCYGPDGIYEPRRVAEVLKEINADLVGLQEVDATLSVSRNDRRSSKDPHSLPASEPPQLANHTQLQYLAEQTGLHSVEGYLPHC